jgi:hypothetical protein
LNQFESASLLVDFPCGLLGTSSSAVVVVVTEEVWEDMLQRDSVSSGCVVDATHFGIDESYISGDILGLN